jgi:trimethylamine--corrinoid protein Co-methyltransferase
VIDWDLLGMYHVWAKGLDLSEENFAFDALQEVPPGGHFLGTQHTMRHFRSAFYRSEIFDYNSAEQWEINGGLDTNQRANARWKQLLREYEPPALDEGLERELLGFIANRKKALGFGK